MSDIGEVVGTGVEGGLLARTVEPVAGGRSSHLADRGHTAENACLNCRAPLIGAHCQACGQRAHVHRTIGAFAHDLLHGVLHFEGKTWRTLPLLAWKPGKLTREYIDGRRASYVSPIALFLFVVFLSFAVFNALGSGGPIETQGTSAEAARTTQQINSQQLENLRKERTAIPATSSARRDKIDADIAALEQDQQELDTVIQKGGSTIGDEIWEGLSHEVKPGDGVARTIAHIRENPQLTIYKAQTSAYKYSWALIPLSVPFIWLLFPFSRRFGAYDHTVFATYSITFMIALVAAVSLLFYAGWDGTGLLLLLYAPIHMYRQLRGTYALGRWSAGWRMLALSLFAWIVIGVFAVLIGSLAA